jgi:hypothetical protein
MLESAVTATRMRLGVVPALAFGVSTGCGCRTSIPSLYTILKLTHSNQTNHICNNNSNRATAHTVMLPLERAGMFSRASTTLSGAQNIRTHNPSAAPIHMYMRNCMT